MVKELMGGQDEQRRRGFHSTSEPRQHADQDLPPNHWQRCRNSWPATRARESGSHAESFKKYREKTTCTKGRTSRMIATWITPAGKDLAPTGWKIRNSRNHGAGSARCAVPRLSAPGCGSQPGRSLSVRLPRQRCPSFFDRSATTRAAARTCPRAFSFRPGRAGAAVPLVALAAPAFLPPTAAHSGGAPARRRVRHSRRAGRAT